jgi:hypothetical protein
VHSGQLARTDKNLNACDWDDIVVPLHICNTHYVALMRPCKLQMKHIPLGIRNLIVQEFN